MSSIGFNRGLLCNSWHCGKVIKSSKDEAQSYSSISLVHTWYTLGPRPILITFLSLRHDMRHLKLKQGRFVLSPSFRSCSLWLADTNAEITWENGSPLRNSTHPIVARKQREKREIEVEIYNSRVHPHCPLPIRLHVLNSRHVQHCYGPITFHTHENCGDYFRSTLKERLMYMLCKMQLFYL